MQLSVNSEALCLWLMLAATLAQGMFGGVDACLQGWLPDKAKQAARQRQRSQLSHHQQAYLLSRWVLPAMKPDLPQHVEGSQ